MSVSLRPKGETFVRSAIALAVAKGSRRVAAEYAADRWGPHSPAAIVTKASVVAGSTGTWTEELAAAQGAAVEFFQVVSQVSVIGRLSGLRRVPFLTRLTSAATGLGASWVGEGQPAPIVAGTFSLSSLDRLKIVGLSVVTEELLQSSDPAAEIVIRTDLVRAVAEELDRAFLTPSNGGTAGEMPASITNGVTAIEATGDVDADIAALVGDFAGDLGSAFLVSTPTYGASLAGADRPEAGARGGAVNGIPLVTSRSAPAGTLILVDPSRVAIAEEGAEVRITTQATVEMLDNPTNDSVTPTATTQVSLWQTNSVGIGVMRYANWQAMPGAVSLLVPA